MELLSADREALKNIAEHALQFCFEHADDVQLCSLAWTLVKGMEELCSKARLAAGGYTEAQASSLVSQAQQMQMQQQAEALSHHQRIGEPVRPYAAGGAYNG